MIVLSAYTTLPLIEAQQAGLMRISCTPDLGLSMVEVDLSEPGIIFPLGELLPWSEIEKIAGDENACFIVIDGKADPVRRYSEIFDRYYSLYPTQSAPTMLISGIPMHRIKDTNPHLDTLSKIKAIAPVGGNVLDTTTGLGYTAIEAAKTANRVITIELDATAIEIARSNPWSQNLFGNPKIEQIIGDSYEEIEQFPDASFSVIIHDPPVFSLAGELYSKIFYQQAYRVLKRNGKLFHYIGDPDSKSGGRMTGSVVRRLREAGFAQIVQKPGAFGVVAFK